MAEQLKDNPFIQWEFTEDEKPAAYTFNHLQTKHLQTELAIALVKKNLIPYAPGNPDAFIKEHEYMRGQIDALTYLLQVSEITHNELYDKIREAVIAEQAQNTIYGKGA